MPNKSATHANEKDRARKPHHRVRASNHQPVQVNAADALARTLNAPANTIAPADILALQRTAGNRAVEQLLAQEAPPQESRRLTIQAKLTVGAADDPYEREADRVASSVMQGSESTNPNIQRQRAPAGVQAQTVVQRRDDSVPGGVETSVERDIERARANGQALPDDLRARMEQSFGADFGGVRVHADSDSDKFNRSLRSRAFTTGQDLFFKRGEYDTASRQGQELIAHELTHVVQQNGSAGQLKQKGHAGRMVQRAIDKKDKPAEKFKNGKDTDPKYKVDLLSYYYIDEHTINKKKATLKDHLDDFSKEESQEIRRLWDGVSQLRDVFWAHLEADEINNARDTLNTICGRLNTWEEKKALHERRDAKNEEKKEEKKDDRQEREADKITVEGKNGKITSKAFDSITEPGLYPSSLLKTLLDGNLLPKSSKGEEGIKIINDKEYELKFLKGGMGGYRLYGKMDTDGKILFDHKLDKHL